MEKNNISWTYWPFKRMGSPSSVMHVADPANWEQIVAFTESPRTNFDEIRKARPNQEVAKKAMLDYLEQIKFANCTVNEGYVKAIGLQP